jgi:hypothetical protein
MMKKIYLLGLLFCTGQLFYGQSIMERVYEYDNAGNRIVRKVLVLGTSSTQSNRHKSMNNRTDLDSSNFFTDNVGDIAVKIYPNPTTSMVTLHIETMQDVAIDGMIIIYTQSGAISGSQRVDSYQAKIDMSAYPPGIYPIVIQINGKTTNWKIIKQ